MSIDTSKINSLDKSNVYGSIGSLANQIEQVLSDAASFNFSDHLKQCDSIAISGMGGSVYNYYVLQSLFSDNIKKPLILINGYSIPLQVSKNTLIIGSSYSGTTEETVITTEELITRGNNVVVVTSGGQLAEFIKKNNISGYIFDPKNNPCGQPRVGLGYMIFGPIMMLQTLGYMTIDTDNIKKSIVELRGHDKELQDLAHYLVSQFKNNSLLLVGAEHLSGAMHIARNQLNETAKTYAEYHLIPELNHHLLEGLSFPTDNKPLFVFYESNNYAGKNQKRFAVTKKVLDQQHIKYLTVMQNAENKICEFLHIMQLNSYISFFLAIEYGLDPALIPWVDYFKKELQ